MSSYRGVMRAILNQYPHKKEEIVQDFHDWIDDKYEVPVTSELRDILREELKEN